MEINAVNVAGSSISPTFNALDEVEQQRSKKDDAAAEITTAPEKNKVQPEELLKQIKGLTENGAYSVRFENDNEAQQLIVKIVDTETDEVLRQVPAEEVLALSNKLEELRGNIVDTQG